MKQIIIYSFHGYWREILQSINYLINQSISPGLNYRRPQYQ